MALKSEIEVLREAFSDNAKTFKSLALTGSADVVSAVSGKKIRVLALYAHGTTTGTIKFQTGATTDLTGAMKVNDGTAVIWPYNPVGWIETAAGAKLNAVLSTMTAFDGCMIYAEI